MFSDKQTNMSFQVGDKAAIGELQNNQGLEENEQYLNQWSQLWIVNTLGVEQPFYRGSRIPSENRDIYIHNSSNITVANQQLKQFCHWQSPQNEEKVLKSCSITKVDNHCSRSKDSRKVMRFLKLSFSFHLTPNFPLLPQCLFLFSLWLDLSIIHLSSFSLRPYYAWSTRDVPKIFVYIHLEMNRQ